MKINKNCDLFHGCKWIRIFVDIYKTAIPDKTAFLVKGVNYSSELDNND